MKRLFFLIFIFTASNLACENKPIPSNVTAQSNIRRYVLGTQLQIVMISCNEDSLTEGNHVYCDAYVRDAHEGDQKIVRVRCDRTIQARKHQPHHESFGCVLNMPPT
ncbi:hypothetical protein A3C09_00775 [Candidatus Uhrbacteria bacterium RIFCSPHIGHO2_02_FULL_47_44]|uniref:DUF5666 domain-containing protein n=1 Tax=Candidatus Uhrbacteria bacterium RIFCSPLOWO2_02_FULL_48_18 TaxID=1802408 RepID=A0A1F7VC02_9BACT|nr:MAG: hypothetical protein A2839_05220 [Candidatus Uhrbacteria bacterium RIFCSPHIGHO2_01_FULL_47_10]OGL71488.1 MAG: hypothetical protein A3C09_00775 [Candidatus Uhrbacteria bacterium RIFCSPHIGHO2_02_FULL_47_44]OGL77667.1 MAG: hypothetical protein A3E97_04000 [Candidatus Uhrbacteria bacterium RIFCSPHIGHO2_12_FULL_47_12]OGL82400.1 MAG: hypothetical protein A3B20_01445 [Candidatus Uhrbacteria bacterium RIFCSPLOWO2_01_FULL_47_17]OGL88046.1 MAG: hypothetical protein A3I41_02975 [Candidatus Uhrbact